MTRLPPAPIAPFGRRAASVTAREEHGAYIVLRCRDAGGPRPRAGQFYMLTAGDAVGRGRGRAAVPPARVQRAACRPDRRAPVPDRGRRPGDEAAVRARAPATSLLLVGPLGNGFAPPREGRAPLLVGGGVGIAPLAIWQDELGRRRDARCSGSATPPTPPAPRSSATPRVATDDGSVGHHGLVTELLERRTRRPRRRRRGVRLRPAGDARGGQGALRDARGPGSARARVRHGVRLRRLLRVRRADRRRLRPAVRRRSRPRRREAPDGSRPERRIERRLLRARAGPPDHQRVGDVRRDRRPSRVRRRAARAVPVRGVRLKDGHARAPSGQPAAAAVGARGWPDQLDRPPQQGPRRLSRARSPEPRGAPGAADRQRDGVQPRRGRGARRRRSPRGRR